MADAHGQARTWKHRTLDRAILFSLWMAIGFLLFGVFLGVVGVLVGPGPFWIPLVYGMAFWAAVGLMALADGADQRGM